MTDFYRLASAFEVLVHNLEMKLAAKTAEVSAHQADLTHLKQFIDRPELIGAAGYEEGLRRILRLEVELKRLENELAALRAEHGQAEGRREKCLSRAREDQAHRERQDDERSLGEMVSLSASTSLAQSDDG